MSIFSPLNWVTREVAGFLAKITPPCCDVAQMMSEAMDRRLPLRKRLAIRLHRLICVLCDRYHRQLHFMHDASKEFTSHLDDASTEALPTDTKNRIREEMRRDHK
jgi:hypothetical protein